MHFQTHYLPSRLTTLAHKQLFENKDSRTLRATWLRRIVQIVSLAGFLALFIVTRAVPGETPSQWGGLFAFVDPLILLVTFLATHAVPAILLTALVTVGLTAILGRVFCGWFCPLGTIHAIASRIFDYWRPRKRKEHWSRWQLTKYFILIAIVTLSVFGVQWLGLLDPFAILYRTCTVSLLPATQWVTEEGSHAVWESEIGVGDWRTSDVTDPPAEFLREHVFTVVGEKYTQSFVGHAWILGFFIAIVAMNFFRRRFWCRYVCPLGGLLGVLSWRPFITRKVDDKACNQCGLCGMTCHGASADGPGTGWRPQECMGCLNCTDACPTNGLTFDTAWPWRHPTDEKSIDLTRRNVMGSALVGLAAIPLFKLNPQSRGQTFHPGLIRPPGSLPEPEFLGRCIACGLCMKICPTGGLQPAQLQAGLEGLWTPILVPRIGHCQYECSRCGKVCPTGAIQPLALVEKQHTRLGVAIIDTTRCMPYAFGRNCAVCEEHCPVPSKAIFLTEVDITDRDGNTVTVEQPHVDPDRCIGCGICESVCPFDDEPAIRVVSANETRHSHDEPDTTTNKPFLSNDGYGYGYPG